MNCLEIFNSKVKNGVVQDKTSITRVYKSIYGSVTLYMYQYDKVVLELDENENQKARNVYGMNLINRTVDVETLYYLYNGHADVYKTFTILKFLLKWSARLRIKYYP